MRPQGGRLSGAERRAVAEYLSGRALGSDITGATIGRCTVVAAADRSRGVARMDAAGRRPSTNTRFQSAQQAGLTAEQVPKLSLKWAFGFPDATSAWSQPTVAGGRLFVGSQNGTVYSLDAKSGCIHWTFTAKSGVRTALAFGRARGRERLRGLLRRHRRERLRARRGDRARALVAPARRASLRAHHRIADALSGSPVRAGLVDGRDRGEPAGLRVLHVPRQPERARREDRRRRLADVHGAGGAGRRQERRGRRAVGTVGRRHLVGADDRRQARPRLRRHRQHLQRAGAADRGRDRRVRSEERRDQVDQAADRRRRLRLPRRQRELRREGRARLRSRHAADARHPRRTAATSSSRRRNRATRSRSIPTRRARSSGSITPARDRSGAASSGAPRSTASAPTSRCPTSARRSPAACTPSA